TLSTDQANFDGHHVYGSGPTGLYRQRTTPVGSFPANSFGLYDMHGNVWEWCQDGHRLYPNGHVVDPEVAPTGSERVLHGGSCDFSPGGCRAAFRYRLEADSAGNFYGCRLVLCLS